VFACFSFILATHKLVHAAPLDRTLKVKLNYTGACTVDEKHKIYVLLFDANPLTASTLIDSTSQPTPAVSTAGVSHIIARESSLAKDGTITFHSVGISPVYVASFLDKTGTYDGHGDPTAGSPMGLYGAPPDKLQAIALEAGKTVEVNFSFDDSRLTP